MNTAKTPKMIIRDMTVGNAMKHILLFAIPIFVGNILQQIYSMVDTMVAGYNLGENAIAAIGATSSLFALITDFAVGINSGFGIVLTQKFGAHDKEGFRQACAGMIKLNVIIAVIFTALSVTFIRPFLHIMNVPDNIFDRAYTYIIVICAGMIGTFAYNLFANILRAVGNSTASLWFLIISGVVNVLLDIILMAGFRTGVIGAAIATIVSTFVSAIICIIYTLHNYKEMLPGKADFKVPSSITKDLLSTGFAMALMYCVVDFGSIIFQSATNRLGDMYITAHTAARRLIIILMQPLIAVATANSTFIGQNWGAGKYERIRRTIKKVLLLEVIMGLVLCGFVYLTDSFLIKITTGTKSPDVIKNGVLSLRIHMPCYAPLGILFVIRTSLQAMGKKIVPIISSAMELGIKIISAIILIPALGFIGTCITEPVIWVVCMIFLVISFAVYMKKGLLKEK